MEPGGPAGAPPSINRASGLGTRDATGRDPLEVIVRRELRSLFAIEQAIGKGPGSVVYLARELALGEPVSLKVLPRGADTRLSADVFSRVVGLVSRLDHPHLVKVRQFGVASPFLWYACPFVHGQSLADHLRGGALDPARSIRLAKQIASVLQYAHRHGVSHGALKPENVLLEDYESCRVRDFQAGAWRGVPGNQAGGESIPGAPAMQGQAALADQYALAVLVYACLCGSPSRGGRFDGPPRRGALPDLSGLPPGVPAHVLAALERALSEVPRASFASVLEFATALQGDLPERPVPVGPARPAGRGPRPRVLFVDREDFPIPTHPFETRARVALGTVGFLAVVAISVSLWTRSPTSQPLTATAPRFPGLDSARTDIPVRETPDSASRPGSTLRAALRVPTRDAAPSPIPAAGPRLARSSRASSHPRSGVGFLSVNTTPWAHLYIDGVRVGDTPQIGIPLNTGRHVVEVERRGFRTETREVALAPSESLRVTDVELHELAP